MLLIDKIKRKQLTGDEMTSINDVNILYAHYVRHLYCTRDLNMHKILLSAVFFSNMQINKTLAILPAIRYARSYHCITHHCSLIKMDLINGHLLGKQCKRKILAS